MNKKLIIWTLALIIGFVLCGVVFGRVRYQQIRAKMWAHVKTMTPQQIRTAKIHTLATNAGFDPNELRALWRSSHVIRQDMIQRRQRAIVEAQVRLFLQRARLYYKDKQLWSLMHECIDNAEVWANDPNVYN